MEEEKCISAFFHIICNYRIKKEIIFFPENYIQISKEKGSHHIPEIFIKKGAILLYIKSRIQTEMVSKPMEERIFINKNKLITPGDFEIEENTEDYFERIL